MLPLAIYSIALLVALDGLGVAISPLLAGFGIGGLAVALAVQPTLSNFFAGTYLKETLPGEDIRYTSAMLVYKF